LLFDLNFYKKIKGIPQKRILYIPEASITLFSFIRAKLLHLFTGKDVYILSLQHRKYGPLSKAIIKAIPPKCIITQSINTAKYLSENGIKNKILQLGVDGSKYYEFDNARKEGLRKNHNIELEKTVLLHVGHIQQSRNLEWLVQVKEKLPEIEIIIVGSTYSQNDEELYLTLMDRGIRVIRRYNPNMEEIYNLADYYIFPVLSVYGAIETPLSVLEAMACNLPVITTPFGSLPDVFKGDDNFHYVNSSDEIIKILKSGKIRSCNNRQKIKPFAWANIAEQIIKILNSHQ